MASPSESTEFQEQSNERKGPVEQKGPAEHKASAEQKKPAAQEGLQESNDPKAQTSPSFVQRLKPTRTWSFASMATKPKSLQEEPAKQKGQHNQSWSGAKKSVVEWDKSRDDWESFVTTTLKVDMEKLKETLGEGKFQVVLRGDRAVIQTPKPLTKTQVEKLNTRSSIGAGDSQRLRSGAGASAS